MTTEFVNPLPVTNQAKHQKTKEKSFTTTPKLPTVSISLPTFQVKLGSVPPSGKTKDFKSMRYHYGYKDLNWCAVADGNMTWRSLCLSLTTIVRVRIRREFYFCLIFLELEFYFFRNKLLLITRESGTFRTFS